MAAAVIGALRVNLGLETAAFEDGLGMAQKQLAQAGKKLQATGAKIATAGAGLSAAISAPLIAVGVAAVKGAQDQAQAMAQVNAALASMGPVAGRTAEQLLAASDALEMNSLNDGDEILKKVTANLLTFGNVAGNQFDRAQKAALDLATRMEGDLQGAALLVGKALNDPVRGMSALSRVGIQLTADQQTLIKSMVATGNTAGAQNIILGELEKQFGGAAAAAANTDPWRKAQVAIGQAGDTIGEALLPIIPPVAAGIAAIANAFASLPSGVQTTIVVVAALAAALGPVVIGIGAVTTAAGAALPVLGALAAGAGGLAVAEGAAATAAYGLGVAIGVALPPLLAIAGAVALGVAAFNHWDDIKAITARVVTYIANMVNGVTDWIVVKLGKVLKWVMAPIKAVGDAFFTLYDRVVGHSYVPDMVDEIGQHMQRLDAEMVSPAKKATDAAGQLFAALQQRVGGILDRLFPDQAKLNQFKKDMDDLTAYAKQAGWSPDQMAEAQDRLRRENRGQGTETGITFDTPDRIDIGADKVAKETEELWKRAAAANDNGVAKFAETARDIVGVLGNLARDIKSGDWLSALSNVLDVVSQVAGAINGTGKPATRTFSTGGIPGFATGGSFMVQGKRGIDNNLLSLNGKPIARVSHGETVGVGRGGASPAVVQLVVGAGQMFEPTVRTISGDVSVSTVQQGARGQAMRARQTLG